jgi:hypothetical protein
LRIKAAREAGRTRSPGSRNHSGHHEAQRPPVRAERWASV